MADFNAELYLRLLGEEALLGGHDRSQRPFGSPLTEAADALVAVGVVNTKKAQAVLDDYALADVLRGRSGGPRAVMGRARRGGRPKAKALKPRRVVACEQAIESSERTLTVRHVSLGEDATRIAVTIRSNSPSQRGGRRGRMHMFGGGSGPPNFTLADDRGLSTTASFSGGGSEQEWQGHLTADQPLFKGTHWIEIDGIRLELLEQPTRCEVSVEKLAEQEPAHRYLWQRLAVPEHFGHVSGEMLDEAIGALVSAGVLAADDPVIDEVREVREALPQHPREPPQGGRAKRLPQPWGALLARRGREDGPEGVIAVGGVTPPFDGHSVGVMSLESDPDGFAIEVEVTGWSDPEPRFAAAIRTGGLSWWAADDHGNHYLGALGSWSGGDGHMEGTVSFWPALAPDAVQLDIMPTGDTSRAVIRLPLAWARRDGPDEEPPA